ncbi:MAG: hypothetical protein AAFO72_01095 [Pseudomonadota bacterium]
MAKKFERLIVHVGMHKTGSTTLQHMLHQMKRGPVGPMDMIDTNHSVACMLWFGSALDQERTMLNIGHDRASAEAHLARVQARVERQLQRSSRRELVISAEWLSDGMVVGEGRRGVLRRLKATFDPHFEKIEIFAYVRPPIAFTTSAAQEMLKMRPGFFTPWADYEKRFGQINYIFGRKNVHLRLYDRSTLKNGDVVSDFQDWMGWPQKPAKRPHINQSLSAPAAALIYCFQNNRPLAQNVRDHRSKAKIVSRLAKIDGPRFALSKDVATQIIEKNAGDLAWIENCMKRPVSDADQGIKEDALAISGEDDLKRQAARFAPLLRGGDPIEPPQDPEEANALAWSALQKHLGF